MKMHSHHSTVRKIFCPQRVGMVNHFTRRTYGYGVTKVSMRS
jgi:hypothetical protein